MPELICVAYHADIDKVAVGDVPDALHHEPESPSHLREERQI